MWVFYTGKSTTQLCTVHVDYLNIVFFYFFYFELCAPPCAALHSAIFFFRFFAVDAQGGTN